MGTGWLSGSVTQATFTVHSDSIWEANRSKEIRGLLGLPSLALDRMLRT